MSISEGRIQDKDSLCIYCFGWPRVTWNGSDVSEWPSQKALALVLYLAHHRSPQPRNKLMHLLWSDSSEKKAQSSLRSTLYSISKQFGEMLHATRKTIAFSEHVAVWLDTDVFVSGIDNEGELLRKALSVYKGSFLDNFFVKDAGAFDEWRAELCVHFRVKVLDGLLNWLAHLSAHHETTELIEWGEKALLLEPWEERTYEYMMCAYARRGEWSKALHLYERCASVLESELDVEPSRDLQHLRHQIVWARDIGRPILPKPSLQLIGRKEELEQITRWLCAPLVTTVIIQGMGGMGKTLLALEVGRLLQKRWRDGIVWVPLANEPNADTLPLAIAKACRVPLKGKDELGELLLSALEERESILILDSAESLLESPSMLLWLRRLTERAPAVKLVLTSRFALPLQQACCLVLESLSQNQKPEANEALQLLVHAIRKLAPDYDVTSERPLLEELCRELGGFPLGLTMLAPYLVSDLGRLRLARLRNDWSKLRSSWLDAPERQSGLLLLFEDIWSGLSETGKACMYGLCVCQDGVTLQALLAILDPHAIETLPDDLEELMRLSLLLQNGERYDLHAIVRHFAQKQLQQAPAMLQTLHERHALYFLQKFASFCDDMFAVREESIAFAASEHNNIRTAWEWAFSKQKWSLLQQSLPSLHHYFETTCPPREGCHWLQALRLHILQLPKEKQPHELFQQTTAYLANLYRHVGEIETSYELLEACDVASLPLELRFFLANTKGILDIRRGRFAAAQETLRSLVEEAGDRTQPKLKLRPLINLGSALLRDGKLDEADEVLEAARRLCEEHGWQHGLSHILNNQGMVSLLKQDDHRAQKHFTQCLSVSESIDYRYLQASSWENLAEIAFRQKQFAEALSLATKGRALWSELGDEEHCLRVDFVRILSLYQVGESTRSFRLALHTIHRAERMVLSPVLIGLLCTIGELWQLDGKGALAVSVAQQVLCEENIEELFRVKLQALCEQVEVEPLDDVPDSLEGWLPFAREQLEAELLKDAGERKTPSELVVQNQ